MTTSMNCIGCGAPTPSSPCEACLDAEAALESFFRSRGLRSSTTRPMSSSHATSEVTRLAAEVERLTGLLAVYGDHKFSCPQHQSYKFVCTCGWNGVRP